MLRAPVLLGCLACAVLSLSVHAEDNGTRARMALPPEHPFGTECLDVVRECFPHSGNDRTQCFYNAAHNPFCQGSEAGRLSLKRWAMNPNNTVPADPSLTLREPVMIDRACIENFDNEWSSKLIKGAMSNDDISQLESKLEGCGRAPAHENLRP